jgi:hypothetical protein
VSRADDGEGDNKENVLTLFAAPNFRGRIEGEEVGGEEKRQQNEVTPNKRFNK